MTAIAKSAKRHTAAKKKFVVVKNLPYKFLYGLRKIMDSQVKL